MWKRCGFVWTVGTVLVGVAFVPYANADLIDFSGEMSDNDAPLAYFDATIAYDYDALSGILEITLANLTSNPAAYTISELFLNVSDDVTGLSLVGNGGFSGADLIAYDSKHPSRTQAGGFGDFDWKLDLGQGNAGLAADTSATFSLDVTGLDVTAAGFFSGLSWDGGLTPAAGALKFTQGPSDDSVYTTPGDSVVPEPASIVLLGIGVVGFLLLRKRS